MGSITRAIDELLGLNAMNLEDALSGQMGGIFTSELHATPYTTRPADPRVFDPAKARIAKPKTKQEAASLRDMDDAEEIRRELEHSKKKLRKQKDND